MALLDDVVTLLESASVTGGATGWTSYKSYMPDTADKAVGIFETGGPPPDMAFGGKNIPLPTFQIMVRGEAFGYATARTKAQAAISALHRQVSGTQTIMAVQSAPLSLGNDANDRPRLTVNFRVIDTGGF